MQKNERAKFLLFILSPDNAKTIRQINPIKGIENKIEYPKYAQGESGLYSRGSCSTMLSSV